MESLNIVFILEMWGGDNKVIVSSCGASESFGLYKHQLLQPSAIRNCGTATHTELWI